MPGCLRPLCVAGFVITFCLLWPAYGVHSQAEAPSGSEAAAGSTVRGLALTARLAMATFPRNALARVDVSLQNVSTHSIRIESTCPFGYVGVSVQRSDGATLYPPAFPEGEGPALPCKYTRPLTLSPGRLIRKHMWVVLRASYVRTVAYVYPATLIQSAVVRVLLTAAQPPDVKLLTSPEVSAVIAPGRFEVGPLHYMETGFCSGSPSSGQLRIGFATTRWTTHLGLGTSPRRLSPNCSPPLEWHLIAGWQNQTVAQADYLHP
jgi:hypothetical protein